IPRVSFVKPYGALYMFPKIHAKRFNIDDDPTMGLELLLQETALVAPETARSLPCPDHARVVTLQTES
ncbi:aminotransferase, partial [Enterobacter quasiroggenkampii]|nr:aminotransferase [Enterobacter quasiroggenkampii]